MRRQGQHGGLAAGAMLIALVSAAGAQAPPADAVDLGAVLTTVLQRSPDIERSRLAVDAVAAARLSAARPFDLKLRTSLLRGRDQAPGSRSRLLERAGTLGTSASAEKAFRSGMVLSSELSLGRMESPAFMLPMNQSTASVSALVPLAGGRGGGAAAGAERRAQRSYDASRLDRDHTAAAAVQAAVLAYWGYLAAHERLDIYRESAARAQRLVEETEVLIRADERAPSDLELMASNRAQKRTIVTAARQTLLGARYALGIAMGLRADEIPALGLPATGFPPVRGAAGDLAAIWRTAIAARRDLAALRARRDGARLAWEGARQDIRPRWDVLASIGYTGASLDLPGVGGMPASPTVPAGTSTFPSASFGMTGRLQIRYEPAAIDSGVRGLALQSEAAYRTAAVAADDLVRRIRADAAVAAAALDNAALEAADAEDAVRLSERSVDTEQARFRLGLATLFDVILAGDALTDARLRQTSARFRFASALVRLRFETGTLLAGSGGTASVAPDTVMHFSLRKEHTR